MVLVIAAVIPGIAVVVGLLVAWMFWKGKKEGKPIEINCRTFFIMGIFWAPFGIVLTVAKPNTLTPKLKAHCQKMVLRKN